VTDDPSLELVLSKARIVEDHQIGNDCLSGIPEEAYSRIPEDGARTRRRRIWGLWLGICEAVEWRRRDRDRLVQA